MTSRSAEAAIDIDFRGKVDATAVAFEGDLGSLDALRQRRSPYPVQLHGEIDGTKAAFAAKVTVTDGAIRFDDLDLAYGPNAVKGELTAMHRRCRDPSSCSSSPPATLNVADLPAPPARRGRGETPRRRAPGTSVPVRQ